MKMRVILFLILTFTKIILSDESNESRYIDLLPEEEKEQFLQKIARRIFEETEVIDDQDKQSREVTDDQLNQHTEFVENILREESENLRKNTENGGVEGRKSEESLKVEPLEKDKVNKDRIDNGEDRYIDLTLRQGRRKKRKDNFDVDAEQTTEGQINVDIKYDTEENKVIENGETSSHIAADEQHINSNEAINEDENRDQSSIEDIQVKSIISEKQETSTNSNEVISSTTKPPITQTDDFEENDSVKLHTTEFVPSSIPQEKTESTKSIISMESIMTTKNTTSSEQFTESVYEDVTRYSEENQPFLENVTTISTEQTMEVPTMSPTNSTETQQMNDAKRVFTSQENTNLNVSGHENDLKHIAQETNPYNSDDITTISTILTENADIFNDSKTTTSSFFTTNVGHDEPTTIKVTNTNYTTLIMANVSEANPSIISNENTTNTPQMQNNISKENSEIIKSDTKNRSFDIGATTTKDKVTKISATNEELGDVVKVLRQRLLEDADILNSYSEKVKKNTAVNKGRQSYKVYELPPNKEPFSIKHGVRLPRNQEQPYYVPIYKYSVNNAYFNPQNRYGPNSEDSFEEQDSDMDISRYDKEEDTVSSKEGYDKLRHRVENPELGFSKIWSPKHFYKAPNKIIPIVNQNDQIIVNQHNHNDYLDTDYYFGRTNINLRDGRPGDTIKRIDSNGETNPSVDGIKDHIRLVRKILFSKQRFGYIPPVNGSTIGPPETKTTAVFRQTVAPPYKHVKRNSGKHIELDYYYGRLTQDPQLENYYTGTKVGYVKVKNFVRYLHLTQNMNEALMRKVNVIKFHNKLFFRENMDFNDMLKQLRERTTIYSTNDTTDSIDTIQKVMKMTNEVDMIPILEEMRSMNISYTRNGYLKEDISAYLDVLNNMLKNDSKPLAQYDWLKTTVEIESAIGKLMEMTEQVKSGGHLHKADLGLLKYAVYLFQTAKTNLNLELETHENNNMRTWDMLPRSKKRKKAFLKEKGLLNRVWLFKRQIFIEDDVLDDFKDILFDLQAGLYDLHNAIKHIAMITKFNNQAWFKNLQRIYLMNDKKNQLEILLHLSANRLFGLIEDSAENGVEVDLINYIKNNELEVSKSVDECVFVLRLLDEIKNLKN